MAGATVVARRRYALVCVLVALDTFPPFSANTWDGKYRGEHLKNAGGFPKNTNNTRIFAKTREYPIG